MMKKKNVLITGGTGFIGNALCKLLLDKGYAVTILSRSKNKTSANPDLKYACWDIKNKYIDSHAISEADYIIHLAGAGVVDKKWTTAYKKEIQESRIKSSELIIQSLQSINHNVKAIISSSAIGWYGPDKTANHQFTETDPADDNFLGETSRLWEASVEPASQLGIRVCKLRTGIVLSKNGGALAEFMKPVRLGVAAMLGSGTQVFSWIHIEDLCRIFIHAIENENISGSYNAVSPDPVNQKKLMLELARIMKGSFFIPFHVPKFLLKLMMGERSIEVLKSTTVNCDKIRNTGFTFLFPSIEAALKNLFGK